MAQFGKTVLSVGAGLCLLSVAYLLLRISETWDKRNTDATVQWGGVILIVALVFVALIIVLLVAVRILLQAKQSREDVLDGNWGAAPYVAGPRRQETGNAAPSGYLPVAMGGVVQYQHETPAAYAYAPPPPPPQGQMMRNSVQYDMGGSDW